LSLKISGQERGGSFKNPSIVLFECVVPTAVDVYLPENSFHSFYRDNEISDRVEAKHMRYRGSWLTSGTTIVAPSLAAEPHIPLCPIGILVCSVSVFPRIGPQAPDCFRARDRRRPSRNDLNSFALAGLGPSVP